jgi:cob(I)alamin adenosyltransferase
MTDMSEKNSKHKDRMQRKKNLVDEGIAKATEERGIVILLSGNGKGKTTAGFGNVMRCLGHGFKAGVVQFIKGTWDNGELNFLVQHCPDLPYHVMATGFTWETQDWDKDKAAAEHTWSQAKKLLSDPELKLVLLDELTYMLKYGYLDSDEVCNSIRQRPQHQSVIITGRGAKPELKELADTVSDLRDEKHAFRDGIKAQQGIDW